MLRLASGRVARGRWPLDLTPLRKRLGEHPPGLPGSRTSSRSRNIARAVTRPDRRDQGPPHDHGTSRG